MDTINLFPTQIFCVKCNFDLDYLYKESKKHQQIMSNDGRSTHKGYQGRNFNNNYFEEELKKHIPQRSDLKILDYKIESWINVNGPGASNQPHEHLVSGGFLAGVLYVKVPKNSGNIVFHDPRHYMQVYSEPLLYYGQGSGIASYSPLENDLLIFPYWLVHSVEENKSTDERISISFTLSHVKL